MWGVLAGATAGLASGWADNLFNGYVGRKSQSTQAAHDYEMAAFNAAQNYLYSKKYNEQNYELAERYATNSALWSVLGLKKAGLNPILAANGGAGANFSQAGVMPSGSAGSSVSGISGDSDSAESLRDGASLASTIASAKQMDSQASLNEKQEALTDANTAKSAAEIEKIKADSARSVAEAESIRNRSDLDTIESLNNQLRQGDKSPLGTAFKAFSWADKENRGVGNALSKLVERVAERQGLMPRTPASAKQVDDRPQRTELDSSAKSSTARNDQDERKRRSVFRRVYDAYLRQAGRMKIQSPLR